MRQVGMKTYRNEHHNFELGIPEEWSVHTEGTTAQEDQVIFKCRPNEAFHIQITPLTVNPFLYQVENEFRRLAEKKGFTCLVFGRCAAGGTEHVWARFYMGYGQWMKKYRIILRGFDHVLTATCLDENSLLEMEKNWDEVAASFCLMKGKDESSIDVDEPKSGRPMVPKAQLIPEKLQILSKDNIPGLKTYRNEKHGFEIDLPEDWSPPPTVADAYINALYPIPPGIQKDVFQYGCYDEAFNFEIAPLFPEPLLKDTEVEFRLYSRDTGFKDLRLGRIMVAGKEHICASYYINDEMGIRWNKKYMVVLGGVEYAITGTCNDPNWFTKREKAWDAIIQTFRLLKPYDDSANLTDMADRYREQRREVVQERIEMRDTLGDLYAKAYEAVSLKKYKEAQLLLEKCLQENPKHVLAHKELAVVLERLGDRIGAIAHRREVERLGPYDPINRSKLSSLITGSSSEIGLPEKGVPVPPVGGLYYGNKLPPTPPNTHVGVMKEFKQPDTFRFSILSYLLIIVFSALYIHFKVEFNVLFSLNNEDHYPLSEPGFLAVLMVLIIGIGASVCLLFLLGVVTNGDDASSYFGFIKRTMQNRDRQNRTIGEIIFSDYTRDSHGLQDALLLQITSLIHSLFKIFTIPFSVGLLNFFVMSVFALLLIVQSILHYPTPVSWTAIYAAFYFYFCYRALLFQTAKLKGVSRDGDVMKAVEFTDSPSLASFVRSVEPKGITPDFIMDVLHQTSIVEAIRNDLRKTDQIGYKEVWRLGLITPDQDVFDPRPDTASRQEKARRIVRDTNYRYNATEQIPVLRTAALHSTSYFNVQLNNILISNGTFRHRGYPGWSYHLRTVLNPGEYIRIRNIQIETNRQFAENRSSSLAQFLREDGFPLKESYTDGDPLTAERGGVIVMDRDKLLVTYPKYLTQRRLIDDEGNLVDLGIDEGFSLGGVVEVKMRPAELTSLVKYAASNGYTPVIRYHSVPYASDFMIPILDAPISISGWADLFIDTRGKGKLLIAREKTLEEWYEMMARLRQLFHDELARHDYHLLRMTKDKACLNGYLSRKMDILKDYYLIHDWNLA